MSTTLDPETNILVESVEYAAKAFQQAGGKIVSPLEDIDAGMLVVVEDAFGNRLTLVDFSKGFTSWMILKMLWGCMLANDAHYLRVFTDKDGGCGDVASVVIDEGRHVSDIERRAIADKLHTGETIFVNDVAKADISVVHPQGEIGFAGVGVLAAAWLLAMLGDDPIKAIHA